MTSLHHLSPPISLSCLAKLAIGAMACASFAISDAVAQCQSPLTAQVSLPLAANAVVAWTPPGQGAGFAIGGPATAGANALFFYDPSTGAVTPIGGTFTGSGAAGPVVNALAVLPNGELVAAGHFDTAGGVVVNRIGRFDGSTWRPLGPGIGTGPVDEVFALAVSGTNLFAGGYFAAVGATVVNSVAKWDGTSWSALTTGLGYLGSAGIVYAMITLPTGELCVGGDFTSAGGVPMTSVAQWNGAWWQLGGNMAYGFVRTLALMPNGDVYAGGQQLGVDQAGVVSTVSIAQLPYSPWVGWVPIPGLSFQTIPAGGEVRTLAPLPDGSVFVGGIFDMAGTTAVPGTARWDGLPVPPPAGPAIGWRPVGLPSSGFVYSTVSLPWGTNPTDLVVVTEGTGGSTLNRFTTTCPASVATTYAGCGPILTANTLPWVDRRLVHVGTGLASPGFAVSLLSLTTVAPTAIPLLGAVAGCDLTVPPDITVLHNPVPPNGVVGYPFFLPNAPPIAGMTFFHQMVSFSTAAVPVPPILSTNTLALTAGIYQ